MKCNLLNDPRSNPLLPWDGHGGSPPFAQVSIVHLPDISGYHPEVAAGEVRDDWNSRVDLLFTD